MRQTRIAAAALLIAAFPLSAHAQQDFRWNGRLGGGQEIEIRNLNGNIRAEPSSGSEVEVVGDRRGEDADEIEVRVVRRSDGILICAVFPNTGWGSRDDDDDRDGDRGECSNRGRRSSRRNNFDGRVDFVVRVPAGVELAAHTVSGDVFARGLRGAVVARSVSGDVEVSTSGSAEAASVSGNVTATLGRLSGDLDFRSVSGNVTLRLPAGIDADFEASTLSGSIESDFPVTLESRDRNRGRGGWVNVRVGEKARATLGRGGPDLSVQTVSGDIRLERTR